MVHKQQCGVWSTKTFREITTTRSDFCHWLEEGLFLGLHLGASFCNAVFTYFYGAFSPSWRTPRRQTNKQDERLVREQPTQVALLECWGHRVANLQESPGVLPELELNGIV